MIINDNNMRYNMETHRYTLTPEHVANVLNINLDEVLNTSGFVGDRANEAEKLLERVSRITYNHIYKYCAFKAKTERMLALDEQYRTTIMEVMGEQLEYMINNGDLTAYAGVNVDTMQGMDKRVLQRAAFSSLAHEMLVNKGIIRCAYYLGQKDIIPKYEDEGY